MMMTKVRVVKAYIETYVHLIKTTIYDDSSVPFTSSPYTSLREHKPRQNRRLYKIYRKVRYTKDSNANDIW